jgi:cobalt-precorrin-7 (C5)-methyltransferase
MTESVDFPDDPGAFASEAPEETDRAEASEPVYAVGIGPGNPEYLTRRGARAIREADVVVGFETVVGFVEDEITGEALTCGYEDEPEVLAAFADRIEGDASGTAVLMGDPNHSGYQFVGKVESAIGRPVSVIPGISSLQIAASRARTPMEDSTFVTLHKSGPIEADLERLQRDVGERHLLVLPRPFDWMPERIAHRLLEAGAPDCRAVVFERLTHDDETVTRTTLSGLAADIDDREETAFSDLSVLAVRR